MHACMSNNKFIFSAFSSLLHQNYYFHSDDHAKKFLISHMHLLLSSVSGLGV